MNRSRISGAAWCVAAISVLYWIYAGLSAISRPFWYDELFTWHIARLPSVAAIWSALLAGVDQNLPLTHLTVRLSHAVFGYGTLATRLPALVGFWVMLLGIYLFLKRRLPAPYALAGMVFPLLTSVWGYAFEARAYGIMLGGAGLALASWQAATEDRYRPLSLAGITLGLAVALASHYTAVLLALPFGIGEAVRCMRRRKLDLPVWIAFTAAAAVTLLYPTLLASTSGWNVAGMQPNAGRVSALYASTFKNAILAVLLAGLAAYFFVRGQKHQLPVAPHLPGHEAAALAGFAVCPALFLVAGLVTHHLIFFPRYGLLCVIGVAGLCAHLLFRAAAGSRRGGVAALLVFVACFAVGRGREVRLAPRDPRLQFAEDHPVLVESVRVGLPVVVPDPLVFLTADFYLAGAVQEKIHYPISFDPSHGPDFNDRLMSMVGRYFPIRARIDSWSDFVGRRQPFLLYTDDAPEQWIYDALLRGGWRLNLRARQDTESLFEAAPPL